MLTNRSEHSVGVLNNMIYAIGGDINGPPISTGEMYNPKNKMWTNITSMSSSRQFFAIGIMKSLLFVVGGFNDNSIEVYNPISNQWNTNLASMSTTRDSLGVASLNDEQLYAVGGREGLQSMLPLASAEMYNFSRNTWSNIANMSTPRRGLGVAALNDLIYAVGGFTAKEDTPLSTCEVYDPKSNTWKNIAKMKIKRGYPGVVVSNGMLYAIGGDDGRMCLTSVEMYNPAKNKW